MNGMLELAITLAAGAHRGQTDKGGQPYILHPLRVMAAMETNQERIVAVLHDAVEDSPDVRLPEIEATFGTRIAAAIDALTKRDGEDYDAYLDRVKADEIAIKVKLADLKDNSDLARLGRDPTAVDRKRLDKYLRARAILIQAQGAQT